MSQRHLLLLPLGTLVVLLGGAAFFWSRPSPQAPAPAKPLPLAPAQKAVALRCNWEPGQRASYVGSYLLDSSFHLDASPSVVRMAQGREIPEQKTKVTNSWRLDTEVEEVDGQGFATVAMRFQTFLIKDESQEKPSTIPGMSEPFLVRLSPRCSVEDFARRSEQDVDTAFQQQQTIASIQWRHASDGSVKYQARERDSTGEFSASYELNGQTLLRKRSSFDKLFGSHPKGEAPSGRIQGPGQKITFGPGVWFASIEQDETTVLTLQNKTLATMALRGKVEIAPASEITSALADVKRPGWVWGWLLGSHSPSVAKESAPQVDAELARMSVSQMLEKFSKMLDEQDVNKYVDFLASWIRSNPGRLNELLAALRGHKFPEKYGHSAVFLALARAGTDEARGALLGITQGREWAGVDRKRASLSLVESGALPRDLEKTLSEGARKEPDVYASVLGQAVRLQKDKDPAASERMREALSDLLSEAKTSNAQTQLLSAVRNTADPSFIPQAQALTRSSDADVRTSAYQALSSMPVSSTDQDFVEALKSESNPKVRAAVVRAYAMQALAQGGASQVVLTTAAEALLTETSGDVKIELVALLGDAALKGDPAARGAIEAAFRAELAKPDAERNADLLVQLGKFMASPKKAKG